MKTAFEVGGDYYDYQMTDDNVLTFGIGDATGHGLQASVMVTAIKLLFSEHAAESDIVEFLKRASYSISLMDFQKIYMAFAIGRLSGQTLELAGAGMPPALIYRAKSNSLEQVQLKGLPLGSKTFFPYTKIITQIEPNDVVILMTDGLPELFNDDGEMLGYERVSELVLRVAVRSPEEIINYLHEACSSWLNGSNQDDDMTLFVFKRKNSGRPEFNI
jgi:serine phosphatase RsbU (regulator of sigma subunit)